MKNKFSSVPEVAAATRREDEVPNKIMNTIYRTIFGLEKPLLRIFSFPIGVSLIAVGKNKIA